MSTGILSRWRLPLAIALVVAVVAGIVALWVAIVTHRSPPPARNTSAVQQVGAAAPAGGGAVDYVYLQQRIAQLMRDRDMVGLAVGTVENGRVQFLQGYGETVAGSGDRVTPRTVFRWASVSKGVAASLVVKLAEQGKLSLDAPLHQMGTTLTLPGDWSRMTVADLLSHRDGLVRNAWDDRLEGGADTRELRRALGTLPAYCPPATCYSYQNIAFDAASELVEHATGKPYAQAAHDLLFAPLGLADTGVGRAALEGSASWARPHRNGRRTVPVEEAYYRVPAAGGVNSSIFDLVRWMQAQMGQAPATLSANALSLLHTPRVPTPPHGPRGAMDRALGDARYAMGWRSYDYAGHRLVGHRGAVDGYGSLILFDPALRSGIVMLWNSNHHQAARLQLELFDLLYGRPRFNWLEIAPDPTPVAPAGG